MSAKSNIQVIIVNDQPEVGQLWERLININPDMHCPAYALSGHEAIEMAQQYNPDVMLMDIMMPGMDGLETTQRVLEVRPEMLIIGYSAYTGMDEKARAAGATDFLLMPITPDVLMKTIRRIYSEHKVETSVSDATTPTRDTTTSAKKAAASSPGTPSPTKDATSSAKESPALSKKEVPMPTKTNKA